MADSTRSHLAETAAYLKAHGQHDKAQSVEAVLAPGGWKQLRDTEGRAPKTLPVYMNRALKDALLEAGKEFGWALDSLAEEAYQKVRDGEWMPPKGGRGEGGTRAVLSVQVDQALFGQVDAMLPELTKKAGYRVSHAGIVQAYLCDELGVERPGTKGASPEMRFPKSLVQHWKQAAAAEGVTLEAVAEEGIRALLQGETPVPGRNPYLSGEKRGPRTRSWSESERQRLWLPLDKDLLTDLRAVAADLSKKNGYLVHPGAIIRAILTDRLGEPAE
ncbi:hypothetical protein ACL07V_37175 [Streptomyces sp. MB22_4]|uniref:hypothetical protein n=1 Tax=Streptomyces sp. MB22_4 TaxID=3383120 RepID=UPI0039A1EC06